MAALTALLVDPRPDQRVARAAALGRVVETVKTAGTFAEARQLLQEFRPDVLITQVRLAEFNGIQLAIWGRQRLAQLRCVIVGASDPALETDARRAGCFYLKFDDEQAITQATLEAITRENPRRQWPRKRVTGRLVAHIDQQEAVLSEVGYGGFCAETIGPPPVAPDARVILSIPEFSMRAEAVCRWVTHSATSGWSRCGASIADAQVLAGSQWRALVDLLPSA